METETEEKILSSLGRLEGKMEGFEDQIQALSEAINRRIDDMDKRHDDMREAINSRLELQDVHIVQLQNNQNHLYLRVGTVGGTTGALGALAIELIKLSLGN